MREPAVPSRMDHGSRAPRPPGTAATAGSPWIKQGEHRDRRGARLTRRESGGIPSAFRPIRNTERSDQPGCHRGPNAVLLCPRAASLAPFGRGLDCGDGGQERSRAVSTRFRRDAAASRRKGERAIVLPRPAHRSVERCFASERGHPVRAARQRQDGLAAVAGARSRVPPRHRGGAADPFRDFEPDPGWRRSCFRSSGGAAMRRPRLRWRGSFGGRERIGRLRHGRFWRRAPGRRRWFCFSMRRTCSIRRWGANC